MDLSWCSVAALDLLPFSSLERNQYLRLILDPSSRSNKTSRSTRSPTPCVEDRSRRLTRRCKRRTRRAEKRRRRARGREYTRAIRLLSRETTDVVMSRGTTREVQDSRDIKIAKPLCLCKNAKFGPSNAKFGKMHKSNAKLLESNFKGF